MVEIMQLEKEAYAGKKFTARYRTGGYYDICACESGFRVNHIPLEAPVEKSFDDTFFGEWLEVPVAYGAFENGDLFWLVNADARHSGFPISSRTSCCSGSVLE